MNVHESDGDESLVGNNPTQLSSLRLFLKRMGWSKPRDRSSHHSSTTRSTRALLTDGGRYHLDKSSYLQGQDATSDKQELVLTSSKPGELEGALPDKRVDKDDDSSRHEQQKSYRHWIRSPRSRSKSPHREKRRRRRVRKSLSSRQDDRSTKLPTPPPKDIPGSPTDRSVHHQTDLDSVAVALLPSVQSRHAWERHLPQSADDFTVERQITTLFDLVVQHVECYYSDDRPRLTRKAEAELSKLRFPHLPKPAQALLLESWYPSIVIKHSLVYLLVIGMSPFEDSPCPLLPDEFTALPRAIRQSSTEHRSKPYYDQAFATFRSLCVYLRPEVKEDENYLSLRQHKIDQVVESFETAFSPWEAEDQSQDNRRANLAGLFRRAADVGIMLFSQAPIYSFDWTLPERARMSSEIAIWPRLLKLTDEMGETFESSSLMVRLYSQSTRQDMVVHPSSKPLPFSTMVVGNSSRSNSRAPSTRETPRVIELPGHAARPHELQGRSVPTTDTSRPRRRSEVHEAPNGIPPFPHPSSSLPRDMHSQRVHELQETSAKAALPPQTAPAAVQDHTPGLPPSSREHDRAVARKQVSTDARVIHQPDSYGGGGSGGGIDASGGDGSRHHDGLAVPGATVLAYMAVGQANTQPLQLHSSHDVLTSE